MAKRTREEWKTYENVFDQHTLRNLHKLAAQGHFDELQSPISTGKEANVFSALKKDGTKVIVKIYRVENCNFNQMYDYLKADTRFRALKKQRRKVIFGWVTREYKNLLKAREIGIRVPTPYAVLDNILVMECIGGDDVAPKVKDQWPDEPEEFFEIIFSFMKKLYKDANMVHADLSEYNILNDDETPVLIDMSQGAPLKTPQADAWLKRDIKNVVAFAKKCGVDYDKKEIEEKIKN